MKKRINVLGIETSNKIAAGEVVERPYSVVKELVENSIDSHAKNITVEIIEGGQKSIKIIDDGEGIHPDDVEKAFMPHATSKISNIDDVYNINTMGFRGEALASIAAVSNTVLKSRIEEFDYGKEISISGGKTDYIREAGSNVGTTIEVRDLFYNVPARLKFLKSSSREAAYISDILNRLALANPEVSFKLLNNNKKTLNTYGTGKLLDVIRSVYGKTIAENIIAFEGHSDIASVHGYIGNSEISRGSRNNQSIFVNKRYIKNKLITAAVENAFKSFLTVNKFPFFIVFLDIFPEYTDINVHPTKSEVKFRDDREIFKLTFNAIHEALRNYLKDSFSIPVEEESIALKKEEDKTEMQRIQLPIDLNSFSESDYKSVEYGNTKSCEITNVPYNTAEDIHTNENLVQKDYFNKHILKESADCPNEEYKTVPEDTKEIESAGKHIIPSEDKTAKFPSLKVIGQFHSTYILAEFMDNLYLIDQHAAHEKILFEKYKKSIKENNVISQVLMTPMVMELSPEDFDIFKENNETFTKVGFDINVFGDNTISIREVPLILGKPDVKNLFTNLLENLKNLGSGETWEVKYNTIAKRACKSAVKANDNLSIIEMKSLIEDLRYIDDPFTCPHGRPTIIKFTLNELEKKFKRIQ
ncbi:DNA mismatch repair endonuclease MutL [Clostridium sp. A1-XYC3]|uniref:DNA mismatch repair protein MutL n=1 Tax=Clostridium tanneri TaxID=3037988 RepID=A0ABU4JUW2_9CLOT|nr:DNA mismatch repair endonuclease MutL [Clostridium sp. A1-XYC3]MDW8801935.1 DNA mismatch repair endonuclease MutL [Clostridium sp. A1-XYC3]